jgi:deoxyribodipyrimidine photo-lyase
LGDNPGLCQALRECGEVVPVFVLDPRRLGQPDASPRRVAFLLACLDSLAKNLEHAGSRLVLRQGRPEEEIVALARETGAEAVYWNKDIGTFAARRDAAVRRNCTQAGIRVVETEDACIQPPGRVLKADGKPYGVFTPYAKAWKQQPVPGLCPAPRTLRSPAGLPSLPLPALEELGHVLDIPLPPAGEKAARECLRAFARNGLLSYGSRRDAPALDATSRLSPHLRFGTLSPRTVLHAALDARQQNPEAAGEIDVFISELIWRDFYKTILFHFPEVMTHAFRPEYDGIRWENDEGLFRAWCEGRTGYPLVDAAMRQLNRTGWMHNRLRMVAASFLTKDLLVDWRKGEAYFLRQLLDGDPAANNGGWQWAAGTGTDAQPYFRIFNPRSQAEKFDPEGAFIEKWLPEINTLDYPKPIVDHARRRGAALALYKAAKP